METRGAIRDPHPGGTVRSRSDVAGLAPGRETSNVSAMSLSDFAHVARVLTALCREVGLEAPGFRSPPRNPDLDRSLLRRADGGAAVAVRLRGRDADDVIDDMVAGACAVNNLTGRERAGWTLALGLLLRARICSASPGSRSSHVRDVNRGSVRPLRRPPDAA